jgi:signal transduction histidine kinase
MRETVAGRASGARNLRTALVLFGATVVGIGAAEIALLAVYGTGAPFGLLVLVPLVGWVYVATGMVAWIRRPANRMGPLLCVGGLSWLAAGAVNIGIPAFVAVGLVTMTLPIAILVHALLAFPSGRLSSRASRVLTVSAYVVTLVLQAPLYLFGESGTELDVLMVADRPDLVALGRVVQGLSGLAILLATAAVLVRRLITADRHHLRVLLPVYGYGAVVVIGITSSVNLAQVFGVDPLVVGVVQLVLNAGLPVAFLAGVLLGGFAQTAELDELGEWLGAASEARPGLRDALALTLGDPTVSLAYRVGLGWVDADGAVVELPEAADRGAVMVELEDRPVGAIIYDSALIADPETVRAAGRVVALALERERLTAQLLASQEELRDSRARLVEAGDRERRRLAQDLHDRLQGRLTLLALRVGSASPGDDLTEIRCDLDQSITELRWLVQGVMPDPLVERGLVAAVEDLADRLPIRTVLDLDGSALETSPGRLPASVEGTAYHVIAEALTNAVKHAEATRVTVAIRRESQRLSIMVADDGVGGAKPTAGLGLRGMVDRVQALGGTLVVDSPPGAGTRVLGEVPCGS